MGPPGCLGPWLSTTCNDRSASPARVGRPHARLGRLHKPAPGPSRARSWRSLHRLDVTGAVTPKGLRPTRAPSQRLPDPFQRLYTQRARSGRAPPTSRLALLRPRCAFADSPVNSNDPLIAEGAELVFNEKFAATAALLQFNPRRTLPIDPRFSPPCRPTTRFVPSQPSRDQRREAILLRESWPCAGERRRFRHAQVRDARSPPCGPLPLSVNGSFDGSTAPPNQRSAGRRRRPGSGTLRDSPPAP